MLKKKRESFVPDKKNFSVLYFSIFCSLVFLAFCHSLADAFNLPKFIVVLLGIVCFLCYLTVKHLNMQFIPLYKNPLYLPLGLFILWQIFCLIFAINKISGITQIGLFVVCSFLIFIVPFVLKSFENILFFMKFVVSVSVLISAYGIFQHYGFDFFSWDIKNSALSSFGRRNFAGEFLVFILPWSLFVVFLTRKPQKILFIFAFLILLFHLFLTFTRASWIGFVFSMLFLLTLFFKFHIKPVFLKISIVFFVFLFIFRAQAGVFQFEPGTLNSRILIWKTSLEMIKSRPISGYGTGNFENAYYKLASEREGVLVPSNLRVDKAHNEFIEIAVENGIVGLFLFLFLIFTIYKMSWLVLKEKNNRHNEGFITAFAIASISGILVNSLASFPLQTTSGCFFFFLNCGILSRTYFVSFKQAPFEKKFNYPGIVFLCMAAMCAVIVFSFAALYSSYSLKKSKDFMRAAVSKQNPVFWLIAEMYAKNAISYNPFSIDAYYHLGKVYLVGNELEKAQNCFTKALRFNPYSEQIFLNLGIVEQRKKNYAKAEEYLLKALAINDNNPEILKTIGEFYFVTNRFEKAKYYLEKASKLAPRDTEILENLSQLIKISDNGKPD